MFLVSSTALLRPTLGMSEAIVAEAEKAVEDSMGGSKVAVSVRGTSELTPLVRLRHADFVISVVCKLVHHSFITSIICIKQYLRTESSKTFTGLESCQAKVSLQVPKGSAQRIEHWVLSITITIQEDRRSKN